MNTVLFIILLSCTLVCSLDDDLIKEMENGVEYYLSTRESPNGTIKLDTDNMDGININTPTKVIIHGKESNRNHTATLDMTVEYLKKGDYNVIQVDWGKFAFGIYPVVASKVEPVGIVVGRFLAKLYNNGKILPSKIHLIGLSMGSHVCGTTGSEFFNVTGIKISRLSALDPPAPLFESEAPVTKEMLKQSVPEDVPLRVNRCLKSTDADIVDAIHTDGCLDGFIRRVGIVDFYPNGGVYQPICPSTCDVDPSGSKEAVTCHKCSHVISFFYFIESINNHKFISTKCNSWKDYVNGMCRNNVKTLMGDDYEYSPELTGKFFLRVN